MRFATRGKITRYTRVNARQVVHVAESWNTKQEGRRGGRVSGAAVVVAVVVTVAWRWRAAAAGIIGEGMMHPDRHMHCSDGRCICGRAEMGLRAAHRWSC